jgi:phosphinothricin acetyltransferase
VIAIRLADPARDAARAAQIYAPHASTTVVSFEEAPPTTDEVRARMAETLERWPWLVAEVDGRVVGYAYAGSHRSRAGYRWSVDISVYVDEQAQGRGVGRALYDELLAILRRQRVVNVYAGIALPNPASVALHEAIGMRRIGVYEAVGYKLGQWVDVAWYGLRLTEPAEPPAEPIPLPELRDPVVDGR